MEENQIGLFIRARRLELGLTQQQLADKLGVTDKAVSKWERMVSYPDITLLRDLAAVLEVSVTELLAGERDETPSPVPPAVEDVVLDTVSYAETARQKNRGWRFRAFFIMTAGCLIAALVLLICALACDSWGCIQAAKCVAFGWAVCYPLLRTEQHPVRNALAVATAAVYPLLWTLGVHEVCALGIVVVSAAYVWTVYWIFQRCRHRKQRGIVPILLLGGLLHVSVNWLVQMGGFPEMFFIVVLTLGLGAVLLLAASAAEAIFFKKIQ